jgi:hypothetical protein
VAELLQGELKNDPDLGHGVEGEVVYDQNGGGVYTLGFHYINAGDPYVETITASKLRDPMSGHYVIFRVETYADALERAQAVGVEYAMGREDDCTELEQEIRIEVKECPQT